MRSMALKWMAPSASSGSLNMTRSSGDMRCSCSCRGRSLPAGQSTRGGGGQDQVSDCVAAEGGRVEGGTGWGVCSVHAGVPAVCCDCLYAIMKHKTTVPTTAHEECLWHEGGTDEQRDRVLRRAAGCWGAEVLGDSRSVEELVSMHMSSSKRSSSQRNSASSYWFLRISCRGRRHQGSRWHNRRHVSKHIQGHRTHPALVTTQAHAPRMRTMHLVCPPDLLSLLPF